MLAAQCFLPTLAPSSNLNNNRSKMNLSLLQIEREMAERGRMEPIHTIHSAIKDCTDIGLPVTVTVDYLRKAYRLTERQATQIITQTTEAK